MNLSTKINRNSACSTRWACSAKVRFPHVAVSWADSSSSSLGSGDADPGGQFEQFLHHILMNESSHAGAPPAADQAILALKRYQSVCSKHPSICSASASDSLLCRQGSAERERGGSFGGVLHQPRALPARRHRGRYSNRLSDRRWHVLPGVYLAHRSPCPASTGSRKSPSCTGCGRLLPFAYLSCGQQTPSSLRLAVYCRMHDTCPVCRESILRPPNGS